MKWRDKEEIEDKVLVTWMQSGNTGRRETDLKAGSETTRLKDFPIIHPHRGGRPRGFSGGLCNHPGLHAT